MKLYLSQRLTWTGTQADAKVAQGGNDYETVEVPTDKPSLITWLNEYTRTMGALPPAQPETVTIATADMRADKDGAPSISHTVEVSPAELRATQQAKFEALATKMGWSPPGATKPAPKTTTVEAVLEMDAAPLIEVLSASLSRLSEIAGPTGWAAFGTNIYRMTPAAKSVERGLGMLMLAALNNMQLKKED